MMRFLAISILYLSIFSSCSLSTTKYLTETKIDKTTYQNLYFSDTIKDYIYKTKIKAYGKEFGGLTIIKKIAEKHYRVVFATEFGSKLLDMELVDHHFTVNFVLDKLNKKVVLHTLKKDFKLLLQEYHKVNKEYNAGNVTIFQETTGKYFNFFFVNTKSNLLEKLVHTSKTKEKVLINYQSEQSNLAKKISITHKNINLKIELKYLNSN